MGKTNFVIQAFRRSVRPGIGRIAIALLALLVGLGVALSAAAAVTWSTPAEIVPNSVIAGGSTSETTTAIQAGSGTPYAAWVSEVQNDTTASNHKLRIAKFTSGAWSEVLPALSGDLVGSGFGHPGDDYVFSGAGLSMAVDGGGNVSIAFGFQDNSASPGNQPRGIGYAKYDATTTAWTTVEAVQTFDRSNYPSGNIASPNYPTIGLDAATPPHPLVLFELDDANNNIQVIRFASRATGAWVVNNLDSFCRGSVYPTMAVDSTGHAHVAYEKGACTPTDVVYRDNVSGSFSAPTVVTAGSSGTNQGAFPTIALDTSGNAEIAYQESVSGNLRLATNASGSFVSTTIAPTGLPYSFTINSANNKLILYGTGTDLKSATQVGTGAWSLDTAAPGAGATNYGFGVINNANQMIIGYDRPSTPAAFFTQATLSAPAVAPTVTSPTATGITATTATLGGNVTSDGGAPISARGVVVSVNGTNANPTLGGGGVTNFPATGTTGTFTVNANPLNSGTTYAYRAYATNSVTTTYTTATTFTTATTIASINRVGTTPTNAASVSWTVTFNDPLSGLTSSNFTLANTGLTGTPTITSVTPTGSAPTATWTVAASTGAGSGTLGLNFTDGSTTTPKVAGTLNGQTYTIDRVAPTVQSINTIGTNPTNAASVSWTVTFSKPVSGVANSNFSLTNNGLGGTPAVTTATPTGSAPTATWTIAASTGSGSGTLRLDMANSTGVSDSVGNAVSGLPFTTGQPYTIDHVAPAVQSIALVSTSPTNAASVSWTVTFSKAVAGVATGNFTLANTGLGGTPAVTTVTPSGSAPTATWTVAASTGSGNGTLGLNLTDGTGVTDAVGNTLTGLPATGAIYTLDRATPTVQSINTIGTNPTNAASVSWTVTFSKPVSGVANSNFSLTNNGLGGTPAVTTATPTGSAPTATWTIAASTGSGSGTLRLDMANSTGVSDSVGNAVSGLPFTTGQPFTIDRTAPTTTITGQPNARTNQTTADFTFSATDPDDATGFTFQCKLDSAAFATCTSPQHYGGPLADGPHTFIVEATDPVGNTETPGVNQTVTWTVDTSAPTATIDSGPTQPGTTSTGATFTFHGSDPDGVADPPTFQCKLDTGTFAACTSPTAFTGLADGAHTFVLQATDSASNLSTPATYNWTIATQPATIAVFDPAAATQQTTVHTAFAQPLKVIVKNSLGQPISGVAVTYAFVPSGRASATLSAGNATTDGSGTASVTATANTAAGGPYMVTANVNPTLGAAATFTLTNTPGAAASFGVTQVSTTQGVTDQAVAGVSATFTITALDQYGNVATGYTGTVHFTSSDPTAVLPPDTTFTAADNGVKTVTVTFKTPGAQSLTATDTVNGAITGNQGSITVSPAVVSALSASGASVRVGETAQLTATGTFTDGTTRDVTASVTWTSDAPTVASVDASGKVTGKSAGTAHVTAMQGSVSGQATVTVTPPVLTGVQPAPAPASRPSGASASGTPAPAPAPLPAPTGAPTNGGPAPVAVPTGR